MTMPLLREMGLVVGIVDADGNILLERDGELAGADLRGSRPPSCDLAKYKSSTANIISRSLNSADMETQLANAQLCGALMQALFCYSARFDNADLSHANISGHGLFQASFGNANLTGVDLRGADLKETDFRGANMTDADLGCDQLGGGAQLQGADLRGALLDGALLEGAEYDKLN